MTHTWVAYYRVSTLRQGESGLGIEAQKAAVHAYLRNQPGSVIGEFVETESGKKAANRPQLQSALALCRTAKATLIIAKLDRLARNVHFVSGLLESGVNFVAVDQPTKDRFMLHVQAAFAEEEARRISVRTKEALAAARQRGVILGATGKAMGERLRKQAMERALALAPLIEEIKGDGFVTVRQIQQELNRRRIPSPKGATWHIPTLYFTLRRIKMQQA